MTVNTENQQAALVLKLKQDYQALLAEIRDELQQSGEQRHVDFMNREPGDRGDESIASELADINVAQLDRHIQAIRDIEAAMVRVKSDEYGVCVDCGDDIAIERLQAYPTAKRCIKCQTKREQRDVPQGQPIPS